MAWAPTRRVAEVMSMGAPKGRSPEGIGGTKGREGIGKSLREDDDVEGHSIQMRATEGCGGGQKAREGIGGGLKGREGIGKSLREDDDVEGHSLRQKGE